MTEIDKFILDQLSVWPLAAQNFRSLKSAEVKELVVGGVPVKVQYNPCRIASSTAEIDEATISARPCFLCPEHRPSEQFHIKFDGRKGRRYNIQVNPYPVFPKHLVIARDVHTPQSIWHNFVDAMDFARRYTEFLVFYNGPMSGASAPDHMHFQACPMDMLPLQVAVDKFLDVADNPLVTIQDAKMYHYPGFCRGVYALKSATPKSLAKLFYRLIDCAPTLEGDPEPRFNLFTYCYHDEFRCIVVLRGNLRSHHYTAVGAEHLTMSPGAADMAGMFIAPIEEDFRKVDAHMLEEMLSEVTITEEEEDRIAWRLTRTQLGIDVPIAEGDTLTFEVISDGAGPQSVRFHEGRIEYGGALYDELYFDRRTRSTLFAEPSFILYDDQARSYAGALKFIAEGGRLVAYNHVGVENYLLSVVSAESNSLESYDVVAQRVMEARTRILVHSAAPEKYFGLSIAVVPAVLKAIDQTWGQTLNSIQTTQQL